MRDNDLQQWLWERFKNQVGYIVDIGASYPEDPGSISYRFLVEGKWNGLLIEPLPEFVQKLNDRYSGQEGITVLQCAASDHNGEMILYPFKGVSTLEKSWADACSKHWEHVKYAQPIPVQVRTLASMLPLVGAPRKIDILKIDTEGHDWKVMQGMDWNHYSVDVLIYETLDMYKPAQNGIWHPDIKTMDFLNDLGFKHVITTLGGNGVFVKEKDL